METRQIGLPNVPVEAVEGFAKIWKTPGGLALMLDSSTKQFALDFARVTLRSFIIANMKAAEAAAAEAAKNQSGQQTAEAAQQSDGTAQQQQSSIILTD